MFTVKTRYNEMLFVTRQSHVIGCPLIPNHVNFLRHNEFRFNENLVITRHFDNPFDNKKHRAHNRKQMSNVCILFFLFFSFPFFSPSHIGSFSLLKNYRMENPRKRKAIILETNYQVISKIAKNQVM